MKTAMSIKSMRKMILAYEDKIVSAIEAGHFRVGPVVNFLSDTKPCNRFIHDSKSRIIHAVRTAGYTVSYAGGRYYIYR